MHVFITATASFLPGRPVGNEALDAYLGRVDRLSARTRRMILANNGIMSRHYAVDPTSGATTHSNAQLAAAAVRALAPAAENGQHHIGCLCCGTSSPDQLMPGHASMVHGELGLPPCEIVSTAGICLSGITALKYAAMWVAQGQGERAVACGSELASSFLSSDFFQAMHGTSAPPDEQQQRHPAATFEAEFLRWMLSDGAGAVLLAREAAPDAMSLRLDWIEISSHAGQLATCMYAGGVKEDHGIIRGWREFARAGGLDRQGVMTVKQDARLLNREVIPTLVGSALPPIVARYGLRPEGIDWFLPHYSSQYFREPLRRQMEEIGFAIAEERWFTNLVSKGNTGSASFFIMLDELFASGRLRPGQKILGFIPESGRFSVGWLLLTVV